MWYLSDTLLPLLVFSCLLVPIRSPVVPHQFPELLSALLIAEQKVGCSLRWRLHEKLLQRYSCLARLLPGELLHQSFSPRIFTILTTNVSTTRHDTTRQDVSKAGEQSVTSFSVLVVAEGVASSEGGGSDILHIPALQPQTGTATGDDGATDPRSEYCGPPVSGALCVMSRTSR